MVEIIKTVKERIVGSVGKNGQIIDNTASSESGISQASVCIPGENPTLCRLLKVNETPGFFTKVTKNGRLVDTLHLAGKHDKSSRHIEIPDVSSADSSSIIVDSKGTKEYITIGRKKERADAGDSL